MTNLSNFYGSDWEERLHQQLEKHGESFSDLKERSFLCSMNGSETIVSYEELTKILESIGTTAPEASLSGYVSSVESDIQTEPIIQADMYHWPKEEPDMSPPFRTGDEVKLKTGNSKIIVLEVEYFQCSNAQTTPRIKDPWKRARKGWYIRFSYKSSLNYDEHHLNKRKWRIAEDFEFYNPKEEKEPEMSQQAPALYETTDGKFGTKCGENSEGKWIIELKGAGGEVKAYDKDDLTEVVPYTVELMRLVNDPGLHPEKRHYRSKKDDVKAGDVLMQVTTSALWRVISVDTKCRTAQTSKKGFVRLATENVTVGQE